MGRYTGADCRLCRPPRVPSCSSRATAATPISALWSAAYAPGEATASASRKTNTCCSCARSRRPSASTAFWRSSSARTTTRPKQGRHRREPPDHPGEPPGQRRVPSGLRQVPRRGRQQVRHGGHIHGAVASTSPRSASVRRPDLRGPQGQGDAGHQERADQQRARQFRLGFAEVDTSRAAGQSVSSLPAARIDRSPYLQQPISRTSSKN